MINISNLKKNRKKNLLFLVILIIFIILFSLLIVYYLNNYNFNKIKKTSNEEKTIEDKSKYIPITHNSKDNNPSYELSILNFVVKKDETNLTLRFNLENHLDKDLINKKIVINFYNNTKKVDNFEYIIKDLKIGSMMEIELSLEVKENITKYEFVIDKFKTYVNNN